MKKYKNLMWACLASLAIPAGAQDADNNIRGMVVDNGDIRFMVLLSW